MLFELGVIFADKVVVNHHDRCAMLTSESVKFFDSHKNGSADAKKERGQGRTASRPGSERVRLLGPGIYLTVLSTSWPLRAADGSRSGGSVKMRPPFRRFL